jgi:hypothetical protein
MPRSAKADGFSKFQRYRSAKQARGMKLLRLWVPDSSAPGFHEEAERQAALLRGAPEERDALEFISEVADFGEDPQ